MSSHNPSLFVLLCFPLRVPVNGHFHGKLVKKAGCRGAFDNKRPSFFKKEVESLADWNKSSTFALANKK